MLVRSSMSRRLVERLGRVAAIAAMVCLATAETCSGDPEATVTPQTIASRISPATIDRVSFVGDTFTIRTPIVFAGNDTVLLGVTLNWQSADASTVTYVGPSAADPSSQTLIARKLGATTVTATTSGVHTASGQPLVSTASITVGGPPASLRFDQRAYTVRAGDNVMLRAQLKAADGTRITTHQPAIAILDRSIIDDALSGLPADSLNPFAKTPGTTQVVATLTLSPGGTFVDTATVTVLPKSLARVSVVPATGDVFVGSTLPLQAHGFDANGAEFVLPSGAVTWLSRDVSMATVDPSGVLTALSTGNGGASTGTVQVLVQTPDGNGGTLQATAAVTVHRPVATVQVTPSPATIAMGQSTPLSARLLDANGTVVPNALTTIAWKVSDPTIAAVDSTGRVTGLAAGSTVVTATTREGASGGTTLTVSAPTTPLVTVTPKTATIPPGNTATLSAVVTNGGTAPTVSWATRDAAVASITPSGNNVVVTANAPGKTWVVATFGTGASAVRDSAAISVGIVFSPNPVTVAVGGSVQLTTSALGTVPGSTFSLAFRDPTLASYFPSTPTQGSITGKAAGTTYLIGTYTSGATVLTDSVKVTVTSTASSRVARVILEPQDPTVTAPTPFTFRTRILDALGTALTAADLQADGGTLRFFNADDNVLTLTQNADPTTAQATPKGAGRTSVTVVYTKSSQIVATDNTDVTVNAAGTAGNYGSLTISTAGDTRAVRVGQSVPLQVIVRDPSSAILTSGVAGLTVTSSDPSVLSVVPDLATPGGYFFTMTGHATGLVTITATAKGVLTSLLVAVVP